MNRRYQHVIKSHKAMLENISPKPWFFLTCKWCPGRWSAATQNPSGRSGIAYEHFKLRHPGKVAEYFES